MELFEALRKRRAVRDFTEQAIPDDILMKLAYAARRAPTGGNTPYRRILVVNDRKRIRLIKQVSGHPRPTDSPHRDLHGPGGDP